MIWRAFALQASFRSLTSARRTTTFIGPSPWTAVSDTAGSAVLARYSERIVPHEVVAETILSKVCADADAATGSYRAADRFGSTEAVARLKLVAEGLPGGEAYQFIQAEAASWVGLIQVLALAQEYHEHPDPKGGPA